MNDLQDFWNKNSARIPDDKGHSLYAAEKEMEFPKNSKVCDLGVALAPIVFFLLKKDMMLFW